ncbi:MAG: tetratricopeptide repeat protein [Verrucomicrobia bacterium]|nr:MAG: tetratricopeptide repeat protein [Verrucomicrobiota bacterium]
MRAKWMFYLGAVGGVVSLLVGCRTPPAPASTAPPALPLSAEGLRRAQALAEFGAARLDEQHKDNAAALRHYQAAARLEPDNETLQMRTAQGLLQQNRNQEALTILHNLVQRHPASERALNWLALTYQATDQGDRAAETYERLIKLTPQQAASYLKLVALLITQGKDEVALHWLQRALKQAEHSPDLYRAYADLYARRALSAHDNAAAHAARLQAIGVMETACHEAPDDNSLLTGLAELYIADRQFDKALACHASLETRVGEPLPFRCRLAQSYAANGQREPALAFFEQSVKARPDDERAWFYLGELQDAAGDAVRAEIAFRHAADHASTPVSATRLAAFLILHSQTNAALTAIQQALTRWPDNSLLLQFQAYVHLAQQAYAEAMTDFARSLRTLQSKPGNKIPPELFSQYALAAFKAGKTDDCVNLLVQGQQLDDEALTGFIQLALAAKDPPDLHAIARALHRISQRLPDAPTPLVQLGFIRYLIKDYPAASRTFEQAQNLATARGQTEFDASFFFWFGASCERAGQRTRAEQLLLRCVELDPTHAEALNYLAYMWSEQGQQLDRALEFSRKALNQEPENGAFLDTLGWIFYQQGRYTDALTPLTKAVELEPDDPTVSEHLGDLYLKLNQPQQAVKFWTAAYQLDSSNNTVAQKLRTHGCDPARLLVPNAKNPSS